ncbi:MAG: hypothetical protein ACO4B3_12550 [Planctomycetota bacterium]
MFSTGPARREPSSIRRRSLLSASMGISVLALPAAAQAASGGGSASPSATVTYTTGYLQSTIAETPSGLDGMYLYPDEAGPGSTGTIPTSGTVRLLSIDFSLRSGAFFVQADCAILASRTEIADSGTAVADASIGEVVARYGTDTTILSGSGSDGASDEATWVRYDFSGAAVNVDVNTPIFVALFRSGTATFSSSSLVYLWCDDDSSLLSRGVTQSGITTVRNLYFARWE